MGCVFYYMWFGVYDTGFWATFYYSSERIFLGIWMLIFVYKKEKTYLDRQFLGIWGGFNLLLGVIYVVKDYNLFPYIAVFHNIALMAIYLLIGTVVITVNIYRHGLYKN